VATFSPKVFSTWVEIPASRVRGGALGHTRRRRAGLVLVFVAFASIGSGRAARRRTGSRNGATAGTTGRGTMIDGGTAYFAEQPETPPDYILPARSGSTSRSRTQPISRRFSTRPLYWFGDKTSTSVDYSLSIGNAPIYSDGTES